VSSNICYQKLITMAKVCFICFRDIKPANILLTDEGGAVLMDLGSVDKAICHAKNSREGQRIQDDAAERCTMPYRAPELFNVQTDDVITEATDIWVSIRALNSDILYVSSGDAY